MFQVSFTFVSVPTTVTILPSFSANKEFTSFDKAVREFQNVKGLTSKDGLYDLETSYLLQGLMYDLMDEQEDSVLKLAKEIYGV